MSGPYGFSLPEILARAQRERVLRETIATERACRRRGAFVPHPEFVERTRRAVNYQLAANPRFRSPRFRLGEAYDRLLKAVGL